MADGYQAKGRPLEETKLLIPSGGTGLRKPSESAQMDKEQEDNVVFWDCLDSERLSHTDPYDAIEDYFATTYDADLTVEEFKAELETLTLEVKGYARGALTPRLRERLAEEALETLLETLEYNYGDPEGNPSAPTKSMRAAALKFVDAVFAEFDVWACSPVVTEQVNALAWVQEHHPEWLIEPDGEE